MSVVSPSKLHPRFDRRSADGRVRSTRSMSFRALGRMATLGVVLAVVGLSASPVGAVASKKAAKSCDTAGWLGTSGRPAALQPLGETGLYVWQEKGIWRVATTHSDRKQLVVQGTISFDAPMTSKPVGLSGKSDVTVSSPSSVAFTFRNYGSVDGIALSAPCASTVTVTGTVAGEPIAAAQFFVGPLSLTPPSAPLVITKNSTTFVSTSGSGAPSGAPTSTVAGSTLSSAACSTSNWSAAVTGRPPSLKSKSPSGIYLWATKDGWQVVANGEPGKPQQFSGRIEFNGPVLLKAGAVDNRKASISAEGDAVVFSIRTGNTLDGFEILAPCVTSMTVEATADGAALAPDQLFVGPSAEVAVSMPFTVIRS